MLQTVGSFASVRHSTALRRTIIIELRMYLIMLTVPGNSAFENTTPPSQYYCKEITWKRIRILGREPTLHSRIFDIIDLLKDYQRDFNPSVRLVLGTNFFGNQVHRVLEKLPDTIIIKSTLKVSRVNFFKPFNMAPVGSHFYRFSDYTCGCRIIEECGLGLTPSGFYMCAVAGGIDRIYRYNLGRKKMPDEPDTFSDQMSAFCRLCGHFGFQWPTRISKQSKTWRMAYQRINRKEIDTA